MNTFWDGFEKQALLKDKNRELLLGAGLNFVPMGTTLHTIVAERPEDHSSLKEWGARVGSGLLGGLAGGALLGPVGLPLGSTAGSTLAHNAMVEDYYDKDGKLKAQKKKKHKK